MIDIAQVEVWLQLLGELAVVVLLLYWSFRHWNADPHAAGTQRTLSQTLWARRHAWFVTLILFGISWADILQPPARLTLIYTASLGMLLFISFDMIASTRKSDFWRSLLRFASVIILLFYLSVWNPPYLAYLEQVSFSLGNLSLTLFDLVKGMLVLIISVWLALTLSHLADDKFKTVKRLSPTMQVLASKLTRILLVALALITATSATGINLTAFAALSGGLGLGIGIGLQKIFSNLISGFILLADRSIKPGDVIEVDGTYGWINNLRARYASVVTRDNKEVLIPNEDLITNRVVNWSHSDLNVRLKVDIGISYNADPHHAIRLVKQAAREVPRILTEPAPVCLLVGFGDSSVDLQARIWIQDPSNGVANVQSEFLLKVWDLFKAEGIEIPFPQRDIHIKSGLPNFDLKN